MTTPRKIMVRCDMEGVTGIVHVNQVRSGHAEYAYGQRMFMNDLLALLNGLEAGGVDEVVLYDEHGHGRNIDVGKLPGFATAICGKPPYRPDWPGGLDDSFMGMILLGLHARAGVENALMPHAYQTGVIADIRLNGLSVGEIGVEAAIAGDVGVPTLLVVADSAGAAEAANLLPGVRTVSTKQSLSKYGALCLSASVTANLIYEAGAQIMKSPPDVKPFQVGRPVRMEVEFCPGIYLDTIRRLCPQNVITDTSIAIEEENTTSTWAEYWQMMLQTQAQIAKIA
jgi:D-amino peptidase